MKPLFRYATPTGMMCTATAVAELEHRYAALNAHAMKMFEVLRYVATPMDDDDPAEIQQMAQDAVKAFFDDRRFWVAVDLEGGSHDNG